MSMVNSFLSYEYLSDLDTYLAEKPSHLIVRPIKLFLFIPVFVFSDIFVRIPVWAVEDAVACP